MSFKKPVRVKSHTRNGKPIRAHFRNLGQRIGKVMSGRTDKVNIKDIEEVPILEVAPEVYDEIKAGVDKPLLILARADLDQEKLVELVDNGGVDMASTPQGPLSADWRSLAAFASEGR